MSDNEDIKPILANMKLENDFNFGASTSTAIKIEKKSNNIIPWTKSAVERRRTDMHDCVVLC